VASGKGAVQGQIRTLIEQFVDSRAFADNYHHLLHALEQTTAKITKVTLLACEHFIDVTGTQAADINTRHAGEVNNVIQLTMRAFYASPMWMRRTNRPRLWGRRFWCRGLTYQG